MTTFERKYSADEKEAAVHAALDRAIKPQRAVVLMAERGELVTKDGRQVRPFDLNPYTLRSWVNLARRKRHGRIPGAAYEDPEGTVDALRSRLIAVADSELAHVERQRTGKRDPEHLRQIARLLREAAAIPKRGEGRSRAPGDKEQGAKESGETTGGLAGSLLRAHRGTPAPKPPSKPEAMAENTDAGAATSRDARINADEDSKEGGVARVAGAHERPARTHTQEVALR